MHYNRKERRRLAKQLGLLKKSESWQEKRERIARSIEAGKQIHQQFLMETENSIRNQMAEREARAMQREADGENSAEAEK